MPTGSEPGKIEPTKSACGPKGPQIPNIPEFVALPTAEAASPPKRLALAAASLLLVAVLAAATSGHASSEQNSCAGLLAFGLQAASVPAPLNV
jgi:hypothetical protein